MNQNANTPTLRAQFDLSVVDGEGRLELWNERNGTMEDRRIYYLTKDQVGSLCDQLGFAHQEMNTASDFDPDFARDVRITA